MILHVQRGLHLANASSFPAAQGPEHFLDDTAADDTSGYIDYDGFEVTFGVQDKVILQMLEAVNNLQEWSS